MKQVVRLHDPVKREDYILQFENNEELLKHLDNHPNDYIEEFIDVEITYKPYSAAQFFAYVIIGGVIGFWIGLGLFYLGEWLF